MSRITLILTNREVRERAKRWIDQAPMNARMELKEAKRSLPQNDRMWAALTDVARQLPWHGLKLGADDWKLIFLDALKQELRTVPNIGGTGLVNLGRSSSDLGKTEMSEMLELIYAFGAQHGLTFHDPESVASRAAEAANNPSAEVAA